MKNYFSDVVHDAIGNEPVLDQYDLDYTQSFYGATQDDFITGTFLSIDSIQSARLQRAVYNFGDRGKIFSKLEANIEPELDSTYGSAEVVKNPSYAERLVPWTEKVSNHYRVVQSFDERERFYDSCLPSIKSCINIDRSNFWKTYDDALYWLSPYGNVKTGSMGYIIFNGAPITEHKQLSNDVWTWSFPFEERYSPDARLQKSSDVLGSLSTTTTTNWFPQSFTDVVIEEQPIAFNNLLPLLPGKAQIDTKDGSFKVDTKVPTNGDGSYRILVPSDVDLNNKNATSNQLLTGSMTSDDMIKFLFGFGDLNNITYVSSSITVVRDDTALSSSYFTGFEIVDWGGNPPISGPTYLSASYNTLPLPPKNAPENFDQFDLVSNNLTVKWISPQNTTRTNPYYVEYPWVLLARGNSFTASFDDAGESIIRYNYVSGVLGPELDYKTFYEDSGLGGTSTISTGKARIYWVSSSNVSNVDPNTGGVYVNSKETHWVLSSYFGSIFEPSGGPAAGVIVGLSQPNPQFRGGKTVSFQKFEVTSSTPWQIAYSRAVSGPVTNYFYSSFTGMPGLPSNTGGVDIEIERLYGTDKVFSGSGNIEPLPQFMTDFTSSVYPPGEYQLKLSYVKTLSGSAAQMSNIIDKAFVDNVNIFTYDDSRLKRTTRQSDRIGYSHYPTFRRIVRDTRPSPYFPGSRFPSTGSIYRQIRTSTTSVDASGVPIPASGDVVNIASKLLTSSSYGAYEFAYAPVIRGWKYGIYNGLPAHSKVIYRRGRFGQYRDMLEQRLFTKFFNSDRTVNTNVVAGVPTKPSVKVKDVTPQIGPVTVRFVKLEPVVDSTGFGTINMINVMPEETTSQNLSPEAACAYPYFDGESKNRPV